MPMDKGIEIIGSPKTMKFSENFLNLKEKKKMEILLKTKTRRRRLLFKKNQKKNKKEMLSMVQGKRNPKSVAPRNK